MSRYRRVCIILPFVTFGWQWDCRPRWLLRIHRKPVYWFGFTAWGNE